MDTLHVARRPPAWACFLALAAGIGALHYSLEIGSLAQLIAYISVGVLACAAVVAGILIHRPARRAYLWLLALGLGLNSIGDAIYGAYDFALKIERPYPSVADGVYLAGYVTFALSMLVLLRSRQRPSVSDALDGAVVLCAGALLFWFALVESAARDASASPLSRIVSSAYPALDVVLIAVLAQFLLTGGGRSASFRLVGLGTAALLVTDFLYGLQSLDGTYVDGSWLDAGWMMSVSLWGAAALHPSIRSLHEHSPMRQTSLTRPRLLMLAAATLITPVVIAVYLDVADTLDLWVIVGAAAITTVLVFTRMALLFREHTRALVALSDAAVEREVAHVLRSSNSRFEAAAQALDCAIYEWNAETGETLWTEGLSTAFEHMVERTGPSSDWFLDHVHPQDRDDVADTVVRAEAGSDRSEMSFRFRAGDGTYRRVWDRWITITDDDGAVSRLVGGMVDVTDRHELEAQLQQSQKMDAIGQLAGGIAHDFNNLLLAISGNAEFLQMSPTVGPRDKEDVREIVEASSRAAELTRQLLAFSRPEAHELRPIDLNATVDGIKTLLARLLGSSIEIITSLDPRLAATLGTHSGLEQIIVNLAVNARDAMPAGGSLIISTEVERGSASVRLVVEDTGTGMDEDTAARVFEPFFTTKEVGEGTGLGLATVYGIVQQFGGTVTLVSLPGKGTRFEVLLPLTDLPLDAAPAAAPPARAGSERILLVEDEPSVRAVVAKMLTGQGYEVVAAEDAVVALDLLAIEAVPTDLVVSDLVMPRMSGVAFAEQAQSLRPGIRFLFISGYSGHPMLDDNGLLARVELVKKPFTAVELTEAVRDALDAATEPVRVTVNA